MFHRSCIRCSVFPTMVLAVAMLSLPGVGRAGDDGSTTESTSAARQEQLIWLGIDVGPYVSIGGGVEILLDFGFGETNGNLLAAGNVKLGATLPFDILLARVSFDLGVVRDSAGARPFAAVQLGGGAAIAAPWFLAIAALLDDGAMPGVIAGHFIVGGSFGGLSETNENGRRFRFAVEPRFRGNIGTFDEVTTFYPGVEFGLCFGGTF